MADLLIKPLTGAGNTVRIQDQAGGAILTSADSGATLGSNITFPAGHVLQVVHGFLLTNFTSTTSGVWLDTGLKVTITPSSTSSKIFIEASVSGVGNSQSGYKVWK